MNNHSIAIYGSSLRQNFDKYSDKDLLIAGNSFRTLNKLKEDYEKKGYSVSTYTYSKLKYLSQKGSLFIEHLKRESSILIDSHNKLSNILKNHLETVPTDHQFKEAIDFFSILTNVPNSQIGFAWFCDCFYVGLRNYLIFKSAQKNIYTFSFLNLIARLKEKKEISKAEYDTLRELRVIKKNYRTKIIDEYPKKNYLIKLIKIAQKLNLLIEVNLISVNRFVSIIRRNLKDNKINHYQKLRLLEIYYFLLGNYSSKLDNIISNPQFYALKFKDSKFVENLIKEINEIKRQVTTLTKMRLIRADK